MVSSRKLAKAIWTSDLKLVKKLIQQGAELNPIYEDITPLGLAVINNQLDIVKILIVPGANVNLKSIYGEHALSMAAHIGNKEIFKYLYPLTIPEYTIGRKVLREAIRFKNIVKDVNGLWTDKEGKTALMYAIEDNENIEKIKLSIQAGTNINAKDHNGNTALSLAKKWKIVKSLIFSKNQEQKKIKVF